VPPSTGASAAKTILPSRNDRDTRVLHDHDHERHYHDHHHDCPDDNCQHHNWADDNHGTAAVNDRNHTGGDNHGSDHDYLKHNTDSELTASGVRCPQTCRPNAYRRARRSAASSLPPHGGIRVEQESAQGPRRRAKARARKTVPKQHARSNHRQ
jgi:hypothetical protein